MFITHAQRPEKIPNSQSVTTKYYIFQLAVIGWRHLTMTDFTSAKL